MPGPAGRAAPAEAVPPLSLTERIKSWPSRRAPTRTMTGRLVGAATGSQQSSRLASFVGANALLVIPPRERPYEAGEQVDAILLAPPAAAE